MIVIVTERGLIHDYDLGHVDDDTHRLEPIEDPFGPKVSPMSSEWTKGEWRARQATPLNTCGPLAVRGTCRLHAA